MIDNLSNAEQSQSKKISRRDFAFKIVPAGIAATAIALKSKNEISVVNSGIFKSDGIRFQPIYETHAEGAEISLHPELNGLFLEYNLENRTTFLHADGTSNESLQSHYDVGVDELVTKIGNFPGKNNLLRKAAQMTLPVAVGDIALGTFEEELGFYRSMTKEDKYKFYGGILASVLGLFPEGIRRTIQEKVKIPNMRRFIITKPLAALSILLGSSFGTWLSTDTGFFENLTVKNADFSRQTEPYQRLLIRLHGLSSTAHPEPPVIFCRNLVMALKIKQFGKYLESNHVDNPLVAFNTGALHSGIEDFISLPEELLRQMIIHINTNYIHESFSKYGDYFSTTRLIRADNNGIFHDLKYLKDNKLNEMLQPKKT
ncbi:hypothetical protein A2954_04465 [Candidatus Roizmanbacteria bacterium RIFCSPLOWO2_01_FULL_37_12]|uniref:Uncharacterized protein n=1 Tax=Candidatus Roizmanbacteria bacterium RIFCSPLOWO2_01_FULL_37_12 TaxID=1802056 RepID=A0A1F7IFU3_9BACT|nr:MAG: hypothetical protein A3D76_06375 [Candidatus Roizmanbacteria bacterium RIFCSPHIGHO2_02_FULL_37_9b]OGK42235.1 MAG: hypothetical protein A2954_04465 [Candidatus Roizmanbacteria bacterium RIFCSPLOWO2_01_FULL_37_12]